MRFRNRRVAGRQLALRLEQFCAQAPVVIALPGGGVPVAYEVARALRAPLDVLVARPLGAPGHAALEFGAIAEGGACALQCQIMVQFGVTSEVLARIVNAERAESERRVAVYRGGRPLFEVAGRTVILVDDGLVNGVTVTAAIRTLESHDAKTIVVAAPVCDREVASQLVTKSVSVVSVVMPPSVLAIDSWYDDFTQPTDDDLVALLGRAGRERARPVEPTRDLLQSHA